jgi:tetratricopeptide (TPR) repeat protein
MRIAGAPWPPHHLDNIMIKLCFYVLIGLYGLALSAAPAVKDIEAVIQRGDFAAAEQMLDEVLREKPESAKAHYFQAQVQARRLDYRSALAHLEQARALDPKLAFAVPEKFNALWAELQKRQALLAEPRPPAPPPAQQRNPPPRPAAASNRGAVYAFLGVIAVIALLMAWSRRNKRKAQSLMRKREEAARRRYLAELLALNEEARRAEILAKTSDSPHRGIWLEHIEQARAQNADWIARIKDPSAKLDERALDEHFQAVRALLGGVQQGVPPERLEEEIAKAHAQAAASRAVPGVQAGALSSYGARAAHASEAAPRVIAESGAQDLRQAVLCEVLRHSGDPAYPRHTPGERMPSASNADPEFDFGRAAGESEPDSAIADLFDWGSSSSASSGWTDSASGDGGGSAKEDW